MRYVFLVLLSNQLLGAECKITLLKTTETSKTAYLAGTSISKKTRDALRSVCSVNVRTMTLNERIEHEKSVLARKIERLKAKQGMRRNK